MNLKDHKIDSYTLEDILKYQQNHQLTFDDRLRFLYPMMNNNLNSLPHSLSSQDKSDFIEVLSNKKPFQCKYKPGTGYQYSTVGSIRTSDPIPEGSEIYYYEVLVLNRGSEGKIAVGLTARGTNLTHQPGWDRHTFGYHGDDGGYFREDGYPGHQKFGPTFGTNDVIGCGLNLKTRSCFFTKNGKCLGIAFRNMPVIDLYPTIGVHSNGETVIINLGQDPFMYNIKMEMVLNEAISEDVRMKSH